MSVVDRSGWRVPRLAVSFAILSVLVTACDVDSPTAEGDQPSSTLSSDGRQQSEQLRALETPSVQDAAQTFLRALLAQDEEALRSYDGIVFFNADGLRPDIEDFLYRSNGEWRSVIEISRLGELQPVVVPQESGAILVLYVPSIYDSEVSNAAFLTAEWMKKYFACQFIVRDNSWRLYENFCFAETDGPYPADIG